VRKSEYQGLGTPTGSSRKEVEGELEIPQSHREQVFTEKTDLDRAKQRGCRKGGKSSRERWCLLRGLTENLSIIN